MNFTKSNEWTDACMLLDQRSTPTRSPSVSLATPWRPSRGISLSGATPWHPSIKSQPLRGSVSCWISGPKTTSASRSSRSLYINLESVNAKQNCSLIDQKCLSLAVKFSGLQFCYTKLQAALDQRLAELTEVHTQKEKIDLQSIEKDREIERLRTEVGELHKSNKQLIELNEQKDLQLSEKNAAIKSYLDKANLSENAVQKDSHVGVLLKEHRDIQLRCGSIGFDTNDKAAHSLSTTHTETDAETVISVSDHIEKLHMEFKKNTEEASGIVTAVLQGVEDQQLLIESLRTPVAKRKRLSKTPTADADGGRNNPKAIIGSSQGKEAAEKYLEKVMEQVRCVEDYLQESRSENFILPSEHESLVLKAIAAMEILHCFCEDLKFQIFVLKNEREMLSERGQSQKRECVELKRELKKEWEHIQELTAENDERCKAAQIVMREVEEKEKELQLERENVQLLKDGFRRDVAASECRAEIAEAKLLDLDRKVRSRNDKVAVWTDSSGQLAMACAICLTNEKDLAFGCGHMICRDCASQLIKCHICREQITTSVRLYPG